ncbi:outer membrane-specific lipoprotein transporter subunit LolE [Klebsiella pneumoniae]|uniref:Outer membrane-specific lipoprotein transporter subunit LolE n=1 Tax=Klebsiella pneumoniae TaxID=573 RepID=A0A2X3EHG7_KLEPN|nr:outer membrane-specific lipoprotein transporter subunit LolE [Klebsiella pneumoniae]
MTGIAIKVTDVFHANKLVRDAGEVTNSYVYIKSWIGTYGYMYRDIQMIRAIMYLAMVLVIGVACFNIVSTLVMAVKDKSGEYCGAAHAWRKRRLNSRDFRVVWFISRIGRQPVWGGDRRDLRVEPDVDHQRHRIPDWA